LKNTSKIENYLTEKRFLAISQALPDRGWGNAEVEVATNAGKSHTDALQAATEISNLKNKER
jgi:hypothetical protein